jgi:hypothetical protein
VKIADDPDLDSPPGGSASPSPRAAARAPPARSKSSSAAPRPGAAAAASLRGNRSGNSFDVEATAAAAAAARRAAERAAGKDAVKSALRGVMAASSDPFARLEEQGLGAAEAAAVRGRAPGAGWRVSSTLTLGAGRRRVVRTESQQLATDHSRISFMKHLKSTYPPVPRERADPLPLVAGPGAVVAGQQVAAALAADRRAAVVRLVARATRCCMMRRRARSRPLTAAPHFCWRL